MSMTKLPVEACGERYESVGEAAKAWGVSIGTVSKRIDDGTLEMAVPYWKRGENVPNAGPGKRILAFGVEYEDVHEAMKATGMSKSWLYMINKRERKEAAQ